MIEVAHRLVVMKSENEMQFRHISFSATWKGAALFQKITKK
jgi:hypothetical protein